MSDRKRRMKRKDRGGDRDDTKPSKQEYAVAKYLRFNCPTKESSIMGDTVYYFTASKAIDVLLDSPWASGKKKTEVIFTHRESVVHYLQRLLEKQLFYRAKTLVQKRKEKPVSVTELSKELDKVAKKVKEDPGTPKKKSSKHKTEDDAGKDDEQLDSKSKKKRKIKLLPHDDQTFIDGINQYVWIYEPTSTWSFLLGLLIVLGSIGVCMFPLWPAGLRVGVYYLSMAAMGFVGLILLLVVMRSVIFGMIWGVTWGRHHFWLLPNLTEDCGFFESFKPTYSYKYYPGGSTGGDPDEGKVSRMGANGSDDEGDGDLNEDVGIDDCGDAISSDHKRMNNRDVDNDNIDDANEEVEGEEDEENEDDVSGSDEGSGSGGSDEDEEEVGVAKTHGRKASKDSSATPETDNGYEMVDKGD